MVCANSPPRHQLQGVAYTYLSLVWKNVDRMILSTDPRVSRNTIFSLIGESPYTPNLSKQVVDVNTRWHPHHGHPFWHLPETGPGQARDPGTLFLNSAVHWILHQLLVKLDSGFCIAKEETRDNPHDPSQVVSVHPMQYDFAEKVAFALAWVRFASFGC